MPILRTNQETNLNRCLTLYLLGLSVNPLLFQHKINANCFFSLRIYLLLHPKLPFYLPRPGMPAPNKKLANSILFFLPKYPFGVCQFLVLEKLLQHSVTIFLYRQNINRHKKMTSKNVQDAIVWQVQVMSSQLIAKIWTSLLWLHVHWTIMQHLLLTVYFVNILPTPTNWYLSSDGNLIFHRKVPLRVHPNLHGLLANHHCPWHQKRHYLSCQFPIWVVLFNKHLNNMRGKQR
mmetsp:Transcript_16376/g.24421  ORF Transcript_16376/g.24421 Transcript_16376/m.24421 type:complete len:233 (+) Transcript_16376:383-1081(+)